MTADTVQTLSPRDWACHPAHIDPGYKSTGLRGPKHALLPMKHALPSAMHRFTAPYRWASSTTT